MMQVLGIEQFSVAHDKGSSHGLSRIIRLQYHEHPDYVPLLQRSYELWHALEVETGKVRIWEPLACPNFSAYIPLAPSSKVVFVKVVSAFSAEASSQDRLLRTC